MMADVVPVIDLGPHLAGRPGALRAAAAELRNALEGVGFFIVVGHGMPRELIERTFAEARRFHAQPYEAKMALRMNEHNNGYMAMGRYAVWTSDVNANDKPDLNEAFFIKRERGPHDPLGRSGRRFVGPNVWPNDLPGFRETVLAYTDAVDAGDMSYRWANGRFKSTPHRALPPVGRHRYAIPFFLGPHIDTVIACLPTCQTADDPARFPPITYEEYLRWWYDANYNAAVQADAR